MAVMCDFTCPVCHLPLSSDDPDSDGYVVCPVCGAVMEVVVSNGHVIPVVHAIETNRTQPRFRTHSLLTHLSIGTMPIAIIGAIFAPVLEFFSFNLWQQLDKLALYMLIITLFAGALTFVTGVIDWKQRYRGRPYKQIAMKIKLSGILLVVCISALFVHGVHSVDTAISIKYLGYLVLLFVMMGLYTLLGNLGGKLIFGK